jgi:hypothetical protein
MRKERLGVCFSFLTTLDEIGLQIKWQVTTVSSPSSVQTRRMGAKPILLQVVENTKKNHYPCLHLLPYEVANIIPRITRYPGQRNSKVF